MNRTEWEQKISVMIRESQKLQPGDFYNVEGMKIFLHPNVYSPKYFPESSWYGNNLTSYVEGTESFLEVGVGSGIISLYMAHCGLVVTGVDINHDAVEITQKNFKANNKKGHFVVSDLFDSLGSKKFDTIFWNHPWQWDDSITNELKTEKTFDPGYKFLERYIAKGGQYLTENGSLLLGSSCYANIDKLKSISAKYNYDAQIKTTGKEFLCDNIEEEYYIIQLIPTTKN